MTNSMSAISRNAAQVIGLGVAASTPLMGTFIFGGKRKKRSDDDAAERFKKYLYNTDYRR